MVITAIAIMIILMLIYVVGKMRKADDLPKGRLEDLVWCYHNSLSYREEVCPNQQHLIWLGEDPNGKRYRPDEYGNPKELVT